MYKGTVVLLGAKETEEMKKKRCNTLDVYGCPEHGTFFGNYCSICGKKKQKTGTEEKTHTAPEIAYDEQRSKYYIGEDWNGKVFFGIILANTDEEDLPSNLSTELTFPSKEEREDLKKYLKEIGIDTPLKYWLAELE